LIYARNGGFFVKSAQKWEVFRGEREKGWFGVRF